MARQATFLHDVCAMARRLAAVSSSSSQQEVSLAIGAMGTPFRYGKHCTVRYLEEAQVLSLSCFVSHTAVRIGKALTFNIYSVVVHGVRPKIHATTVSPLLVVEGEWLSLVVHECGVVWCG